VIGVQASLGRRSGETGSQRAFVLPYVVYIAGRATGAALTGGDGERADMDAVGFGTLQQRHMSQFGCRLQEGGEQITEHAVVGGDLVVVAPALDQPGQFEQGRVDEVRDVLQRP